MEPSGGDLAAKRAKPSAGGGGNGEDRLSALPDDVLVLILLGLRSAAAAGRTSVLSRRWRRLWALLPELRFPVAPEPPHRLRAALEAHEAPLRFLLVGSRGAAPDAVAAWLPAAARRLSGFLIFVNLDAADDGGVEAAGGSGFFELPCFENATKIGLTLGFLGLAVPPAGVFARLTDLFLSRVRFHSPRELGDAVSSPRCPSLERLTVHDARGLSNLRIHSESLLELELQNLDGLQQLTVVAPALKELKLSNCFAHNQPVADISAPQLLYLRWMDPYDPSSVRFGNMAQLRALIASYFLVYGPHNSRENRSMLRLLERFQDIRALHLRLAYLQNIGNFQYLMEDLVLPRHMYLSLVIFNNGHAFGASFFHVLRMCTGLKGLMMMLNPDSDVEITCTICMSVRLHLRRTNELENRGSYFELPRRSTNRYERG
ncbi:hypothetical protein ACP70R_015149 [Stipagrostis hirtigluma subsp. patula]